MRSFRPTFALLPFLILPGCSIPGAPATDPAPAGPDLPPAEHLAELDRILLQLHNDERAQVGVPSILWDRRLAAAAAAYASALAAGGRLVHSSALTRRGQGEDLWMGTHARYTLRSMFAG
jgi:uncharacterized protein YkwD